MENRAEKFEQSIETNDSIDLVFFDTNDRSVAESFGIFDESKFYIFSSY